MVPNHSGLPVAGHLCDIPTGSPSAGALNTGLVYEFRDF